MVRPEHLHYDVIEEHLKKSITQGSDFLFDTKKLEAELRRLWEIYDVPVEVRHACVCRVVVRGRLELYP